MLSFLSMAYLCVLTTKLRGLQRVVCASEFKSFVNRMPSGATLGAVFDDSLDPLYDSYS